MRNIATSRASCVRVTVFVDALAYYFPLSEGPQVLSYSLSSRLELFQLTSYSSSLISGKGSPTIPGTTDDAVAEEYTKVGNRSKDEVKLIVVIPKNGSGNQADDREGEEE